MSYWRLYLIYATIVVAVAMGIAHHLKQVMGEYHSTSSLEQAAAYLERSK